MNTHDATTAQDITALSVDWAAAELHGDASALGRLLAHDFMAVGPRGFLLTKEDWLQRITSGSLRYSQFDWDEATVRVYGDSAVVIGRQTQAATYQDHPIEGQFRTTLICILRDGHWQLAGLHLSPIAGPLPGLPPSAGLSHVEA